MGTTTTEEPGWHDTGTEDEHGFRESDFSLGVGGERVPYGHTPASEVIRVSDTHGNVKS